MTYRRRRRPKAVPRAAADFVRELKIDSEVFYIVVTFIQINWKFKSILNIMVRILYTSLMTVVDFHSEAVEIQYIFTSK